MTTRRRLLAFTSLAALIAVVPFAASASVAKVTLTDAEREMHVWNPEDAAQSARMRELADAGYNMHTQMKLGKPMMVRWADNGAFYDASKKRWIAPAYDSDNVNPTKNFYTVADLPYASNLGLGAE